MKSILILVLWLLLSLAGTSAADSAITPATGASRHVLLLGIDGFRVDSLVEAETPHLDAIMKRGAYSLKAVSSTGQPTVSGPSWSSILTGVWFNKHGVRNNEFGGQRFADYPSCLVRVEDHLPGAITASIVNWAPINQHIPNRADVEKRGLPDAAVTAEAARLIVEQGPHALFVQFDELDGAGHRGGYHPGNPDYLAMVAAIDRHVGAILAAVTNRKSAHPDEQWLVIIVSDHGGTPDGKHGGQSPDEVIVPFLMTGDGVAPGQLMSKVFNVDASVTALAWLGIAVEPAWNLDGRPQGLAAPSR
jgi:predicted AlkP superfamily pyrophosphatase or phosphodiesterase